MSQNEIVSNLNGLNSLELKSIITHAERIVKIRLDQRTLWNSLKSAPRIKRAM
jgi:hypothetical protein